MSSTIVPGDCVRIKADSYNETNVAFHSLEVVETFDEDWPVSVSVGAQASVTRCDGLVVSVIELNFPTRLGRKFLFILSSLGLLWHLDNGDIEKLF